MTILQRCQKLWLSLNQDQNLKKRAMTAAIIGAIFLMSLIHTALLTLLILGVFGYVIWKEWPALRTCESKPVWTLFGVIYLLPASMAALVLYDQGIMNFLWFVVLIILNDVSAYFLGKSLQGPPLAPLISPNKTRSGFVGALMVSAIYGFFTDYLILALILSLMAQGGDLFMSYLKRRAGVKDTGTALPGHGGFLDRLDSYLLALPVAAVLFIFV